MRTLADIRKNAFARTIPTHNPGLPTPAGTFAVTAKVGEPRNTRTYLLAGDVDDDNAVILGLLIHTGPEWRPHASAYVGSVIIGGRRIEFSDYDDAFSQMVADAAQVA